MGSNDESTGYGFLCGADMEPEKIRRHPRTAGSRFAGIGSVPVASIAEMKLPLPDVEEVWGVVVTLSGSDGSEHGLHVAVSLRSGEQVQAVVLTDTASFGAVDDVVAEAYYWELPRAWREALAGDPVR